MTKLELVNAIAQKTGGDKKEILNIIEVFMSTVKEKMNEGEEIYLREFGSFIIKHRAEKTARNISQNTTLIIPEHNIPMFKPSRHFIEMLQK